MNRYVKEMQVKALYGVARFVFLNHDNPINKSLTKVAVKVALRRSGNDALDFLDEADSKDEQF